MSANEHLEPRQMHLFMPQAPDHTWVDDEQNEAFVQRLVQGRAAADQSSFIGRAKTALLSRHGKKPWSAY